VYANEPFPSSLNRIRFVILLFALYIICESRQAPEWEPVLVVGSRKVTMNKLALKIPPSSSTVGWLLSIAAGLFSGVVKDYVCTQLEAALFRETALMLGAANSVALTCWPMLHDLLQVWVGPI